MFNGEASPRRNRAKLDGAARHRKLHDGVPAATDDNNRPHLANKLRQAPRRPKRLSGRNVLLRI